MRSLDHPSGRRPHSQDSICTYRFWIVSCIQALNSQEHDLQRLIQFEGQRATFRMTQAIDLRVENVPAEVIGVLSAGVVLFARHGDRLEFFQDPFTYDPSGTTLTPLGSVQEFQLGTFLRSTYLNQHSPSFIEGISADVVDINQLIVRADAAGEGNIILQSVTGLLQGLFPPTPHNNITLANGTTVITPLGGYQYIPVESVEPDEDISLNSFTSCPNFDQHTADFYASPLFLAEAAQAAPFLAELQPFADNRSIDFTNMFNIFDFATALDPEVAGIVDYAAVVALELHGGAHGAEPTVSIKFKNGTSDPKLHTLHLFGSHATNGVPLSQFIDLLAPAAVNSTQEWCTLCNQTTLRGCSVFNT
ncbi:Lysosomal acid phosphatase [Grifola frondosa]|uniref:Lysosomal acid phosphatase n=1 Tax=Grifola frondosa TaxID=5627 RepID=A0A1C7MJ15_GRIFR|nr:Lysosomal acid phosphatase [Grifola frondosa]